VTARSQKPEVFGVPRRTRREKVREVGALPNVIVIGVSKCGTSALHYCLDLHPEISMSHPKELNFFIDEVQVDGQVSISSPSEREELERAPRNWSRGPGWYRRHFSSNAPVRGESSPRYSEPWFAGVPERMAATLPDAKLILMVRDPLERMLSHHAHLRAAGREQRDVAEAFAAANNLYLVLSRYYRQLERFLEHYRSSKILVVAQEDLQRRPAETMRSVYGFLGVDDTFSSPKLSRQRHRTSAKGRRFRAARRLIRLPGMRMAYRLPEEVKWGLERLVSRRESGREASTPLDEELRASLVAQLAPDAARFRRYTGREFAEWSV
jgi:hypothetical protein